MSDSVRAYVNHGRWVGDCIRQYCNNAEKLEPRQDRFQCSNCLLVAAVEWPADADDIWEVLSLRPVPQTRNWFPAEHDLAVRSRAPHGQTVADLLEENAMFGVK